MINTALKTWVAVALTLQFHIITMYMDDSSQVTRGVICMGISRSQFQVLSRRKSFLIGITTVSFTFLYHPFSANISVESARTVTILTPIYRNGKFASGYDGFGYSKINSTAQQQVCRIPMEISIEYNHAGKRYWTWRPSLVVLPWWHCMCATVDVTETWLWWLCCSVGCLVIWSCGLEQWKRW